MVFAQYGLTLIFSTSIRKQSLVFVLTVCLSAASMWLRSVVLPAALVVSLIIPFFIHQQQWADTATNTHTAQIPFVVRYNSTTIMLEELRRITSTEPYKSYGGMRMKEILIKPWENPDAKFVLEIWTDDREDAPSQVWEVVCDGLAQTDGIPQAIIPSTELKLFDNHPVLWHLDDEIYFSITSKSKSISSLMGDLFIEHTKACGNWVDFHWHYSSLPETLTSLRENQLKIPARLKDTCFQIFEKYGVSFRVNSIQKNDTPCQVLFFSKSENWPDKQNFKQSYIIAERFSERRIS